jgi:hypothetical protein
MWENWTARKYVFWQKLYTENELRKLMLGIET